MFKPLPTDNQPDCQQPEMTILHWLPLHSYHLQNDTPLLMLCIEKKNNITTPFAQMIMIFVKYLLFCYHYLFH
jgi:hypothetical protein